MTSGVYLIRNTETDKVYVGGSMNIERRWQAHNSVLRRGIHHSDKLQNAWNKYGADKFQHSIIEVVDKCDVQAREQYWIDYYEAAGNEGYNVAVGVGCNVGKHMALETIEKMRALWTQERRAKQAACLVGRKHSTESIQKMCDARRGRPPMSEEVKAKIANTLKGRKLPIETREKIRLAGIGRIHSEETKKKIGSGNTGKLVSEQTREKLRVNSAGKKYGVETKEKLRKIMLGNTYGIGMHWYTDGVSTVLAHVCPDGFKQGRTYSKKGLQNV